MSESSLTHHVLYVDEGILASPLLKQCQRVADELTQTVILLLAIVNAITKILVPAGAKAGLEGLQPC